MRRAIISDIHSNVEALDAVMRDIERQGITSILCLGDVIGYGPEPRATLARAFDYEITLLGNHEEAAMYYGEDFNERARIALDWTRDQLNSRDHSPEENSKLWAFIGTMPTSHQIDNGLLVHGSPRDPVREYMLPRDARDPDKMQEVFEAIPTDFCFVGHSHVPGVYTQDPSFLSPPRVPDGFRLEDGKALVNVGSVGQPRDGDTRASYVTWEGDTVWFHRVEYDYRKTQRKILDTEKLPRYLAVRLQEGR
jgi:diadenosine tetraphosphatase ApaH/serine/threonine PP2A family protein phosphatase